MWSVSEYTRPPSPKTSYALRDRTVLLSFDYVSLQQVFDPSSI